MSATQDAGNGGDRTVAEVLVDYLARAGVKDVFGVAGSTIMPILDGMATDGRINYVGARYELSAAEMASGYARASASLGVVMTHCGPGATSALTAMVGAARDGVPLLLITGNEESQTLVRQPYHDWEILRVMGTITPFSYQISRADELPHVVRRAVGEAVRGVTQAVHIDLPEDIALQTVPAEDVEAWLHDVDPVLASVAAAGAVPLSRPVPNPDEVERAAGLLADARTPLVVLGETLQWYPAKAEVVGRCAALGIPFVTSHGGRGGIGDADGYAGTIGRFGSRDANALVGEADVILALGAELSDIDTVRWRVFDPEARIIAVHPDPTRIDRRVAPTLGVMADVDEFLRVLAPRLEERGAEVSSSWRERAGEVDRSNGPLGDTSHAQDAPIDARLVAATIEAAPDSWVVTADPGFGPLTLLPTADFGGSRFLYAYSLGAMGFAVPSAIGATIAEGVEGAVAVVGDGSLFMSLSSLESIASLDVPVVVIVLDDGGFGSQRKKQLEGYGRNVGVDYENPDIAAIAAAMGIESRWIETPDDVDELCRSLPGRKRGVVAVVKRDREQKGNWYEGSNRRR